MSLQTLKKYAVVSAIFFALYYIYIGVWIYVTQKYSIEVPPTYVMASDWGRYIVENPFPGLLILLTSAVFEEAIYRMIPLVFFLYIPKLQKFWLIAALVSSVLFGYGHGNAAQAYLAGGFGLIFCIQTFTYWKTDPDKKKDLAHACMATAFMHFVFNAIAVYVF